MSKWHCDEATQALLKTDRVLAKLIREVGPISYRPDPKVTPYMYLVRSVAYQQLTGKAAATILGRVIALFPEKKFPDPEDLISVPEKKLRAAGLSGSKVLAVKDIAAKALDGTIPPRREIAKLSNEEIIERLTMIRGVGQWTVEMVLIFNLGRPDVLPVTDYGVRKGFAKTYRWGVLPTPKELAKHGEKWRPFRSAAAWYLWRSLERA